MLLSDTHGLTLDVPTVTLKIGLHGRQRPSLDAHSLCWKAYKLLLSTCCVQMLFTLMLLRSLLTGCMLVASLCLMNQESLLPSLATLIYMTAC